MRSFFDRLRQRKVAQWAIGYLAAAGGTMQVVDILGTRFAWNDGFVRAIYTVLGFAFLAVLVIAYFHGEKGRQRVTGIEVLLLGAIALTGLSAAAFELREPSPEVAARRAAAGPVDRSIAVLPFRDLSPHQDQEYFSDGVTEEILNALAQVPGLRVAARSSSFSFKGRDLPVADVARKLHVSTLLEGSVRREGNHVRITAQFIDARDGHLIWSKPYDRELKDVFQAQEEIARAITEALQLTFSASEAATTAPTSSPEAHDLYLRGLAHWNHRTGDDLQEAIDAFEEAIRADSTYAQAYAGLASAYVLVPLYSPDVPARDAMPRARAAAQRALALDPSLAEAHTALALVRYLYDWNWAQAEPEFRRAIELNPSYATGHHWYGLSMAIEHRDLDRALDELLTAQRLDPLSLIIPADIGVYHVLRRQFDRATPELEQVLSADPSFPEAVLWAGYAYLATNRYDDAVRVWSRAPAMAGLRDSSDVATVIRGIASPRHRAAALRVLAAAERVPHPALVDLAGQYALLGQRDDALRLLARAVQERDFRVLYVRSLPAFDALRSDPRFLELQERGGSRQEAEEPQR